MRKMRDSLLIVLFVAAAIAGLPESACAANVDIEGEILTHPTDQPATVRLLSGKTPVQETIADLKGRFKFKKVAPGPYTIHVERDGYSGKDITVQVADSTQHVSIALEAVRDNPEFAPAFDPFRDFEIPAKAKKEFNLGTSEEQKGCARALPHFQKAVALYPQYSEAFTEIGRCNLQMNDVKAAEEAFKRAVQFSAEVYPMVNLANLYLTEGRTDEALELITRSVRKNPTDGELYATLTRIYFAKGRLREAEVAGHEAHSRGHQSPDIHIILAKIYEGQQNRSAQMTQLMTYLDEKPSGPAADQARKQLDDLKSRK
jgi:tetratricopeptide (TPR) repeat protein